MLRARLQDALRPVGIVRRFYYLDHVTSTQDRARHLIQRASGSPDLHGTLIVTGYQTAGRGRLGRSWEAPPDRALLFSLVLSEDGNARSRSFLPTAVPVAVAEGIGVATGRSPRIKFPNDILVDRRKVAGILIEQATARGREFLIVGIGINVNQAQDELPETARQTPTSLAIATGHTFDLPALLATVLGRLESYCTAPDPGRAAARMNALCDTVGHLVEIETATGLVHGTALAIAEDGALIVLTDSGLRRPVYAGDVRLLSMARQAGPNAT